MLTSRAGGQQLRTGLTRTSSPPREHCPQRFPAFGSVHVRAVAFDQECPLNGGYDMDTRCLKCSPTTGSLTTAKCSGLREYGTATAVIRHARVASTGQASLSNSLHLCPAQKLDRHPGRFERVWGPPSLASNIRWGVVEPLDRSWLYPLGKTPSTVSQVTPGWLRIRIDALGVYGPLLWL